MCPSTLTCPELCVAAASTCRIAKHAEDHYTVSFKSPDGPEQTLEVGLVMMATGRSPRTEGLNLEVNGDLQHIHSACSI